VLFVPAPILVAQLAKAHGEGRLGKTGRPVQFEITEQTRAAIRDWLANTAPGQCLFPSRFHDRPHISTRQYARIVHRWVDRAGIDSSA
jgi:integrase